MKTKMMLLLNMLLHMLLLLVMMMMMNDDGDDDGDDDNTDDDDDKHKDDQWIPTLCFLRSFPLFFIVLTWLLLLPLILYVKHGIYSLLRQDEVE